MISHFHFSMTLAAGNFSDGLTWTALAVLLGGPGAAIITFAFSIDRKLNKILDAMRSNKRAHRWFRNKLRQHGDTLDDHGARIVILEGGTRLEQIEPTPGPASETASAPAH